MIRILLEKRQQKRISWMLLSIMLLELITPTLASALSSGPVQPEISSFEPVGTTDMVDLFTGDFVYNIPLMDVEGYPINISYHGGVTMDQEASWVGLGWNINPGAINRTVRGLPDEFNGDTIEKEMNIKPEINKKIGLEGGIELGGVGDPNISIGASLGGYLNISNYRGVSVDFTASAGVNTKLLMISAGLNVGASVGSQAGASIDYNTTIGVGASQTVSKDMAASGSFNLNYGGTYSPRTSLRRSAGFSAGVSLRQNGTNNSVSMSTGTSVPIGTQNYTAAITNPSYMNTVGGQLKLGGEVFGLYFNGKIAGSINTIKYDLDGSRQGYGYFNLANATDNDLLDFSREKDGMYNTTMQLLPQSNLTYDVYNVSGQGTGGSFRPFRNDIGSVYDPVTKGSQNSKEGAIEAGLGNAFEIGGEVTISNTKSESGPWENSNYYRKFQKRPVTGYNEDIYFKEAGELTQNNETYLNAYANSTVVKPEDVASLPLSKTGANTRIVRSNHIYTISGSDDDTAVLLDGKQLYSYKDTTGFKNYPLVHKDTIARVTKKAGQRLKRKTNQVTEIVQNQKDGRRYVYGLPVVNNVQREATFAVDTTSSDNPVDMGKYLVGYNAGVDDSKNNGKGLDHFYSSTVTPTYTTAHLLTSVLSTDYVDVTGNGISDDDLGTYTKFNYSRKSADYRWRSPIQSGKAQYMPGYKTDKKDDKASYIIGSREQWMLHSIETKNYVAEFYVSVRQDAQGVLDRIINGGLASSYNDSPYNAAGNVNASKSYKLDSIVLYNKHDRFTNPATAQPIKTVLFTYDYSLCKNVPNAVSGSGKLTLKKIQVRYGKSNLNMSAAYAFKYSTVNPDYDDAAKDRWGMYKPNNTQFNNYEFPFTVQASTTNDNANAWSLTEIDLPSGGVIKPEYESDDYAYVQNKEAMEMFKIAGFGNTTTFGNGNMLYMSPSQPNLYFYFKRRKDAENSQLSFADNYLKGTNLLYYNIPVALTGNKFEPIKGYAEVAAVGYCNNDANSDYGYVKVAARSIQGSSTSANPVTFAALNVGRYNLPQILFPGSDPDATDMDNIVAGLKNSIKEMFEMASNPLANMINASKAKYADNTKALVRLTSPGLMKKGGGQRVKTIRFYDSWDAMAGGNPAVYGKKYAYTLKRDDGKGVISSGVASYEPIIGGDELPQRVPVGYTAQRGNNFPPNDPVDLYQELPIGESFYPGGVVGYSNVVVSSINSDVGRSAQTQDISGFYTAKDFPIQASASAINSPAPKRDFSITDITIEQETTQGFSMVFNDMHGKPRNTEHWLIKPADTIRGKELLNMQKYEYLTSAGQLSNTVPVFDRNASAGKLSVATHTMGIETDLTTDSRIRTENTSTSSVSLNFNSFFVGPFFIPILMGYPFTYDNNVYFRCATTTKVTQQYGILSKVISNNEGAVTEVHNEVFDQNTGNALVTSVNNEFNDREYNVSYPAYWAYKELGPAYENFDLRDTFTNNVLIDTFGVYAKRFVNYNPSFSTQYLLPSNMPVARIQIDEEMPKFKLGDEMLLSSTASSVPIKTWTMGYTSDSLHCYLILATREPYKTGSFWSLGSSYSKVAYRVTRSGNKNRLGETIQSYSTADSSNIFPYLKNNLTNLISLNAQTYKHNLNQVYAANQVSDSLNPFTTGKVGIYRPEQQILNLKKRSYTGGTTRNAGLFGSASYWQTEQDKFYAYCPDSVVCISECPYYCPNAIDTLKLTYLGGDSMRVNFTPHLSDNCHSPNFYFTFPAPVSASPYVTLTATYAFSNNSPGSFVLHSANLVGVPAGYNIFANPVNFHILYNNGCCYSDFYITFNGANFGIQNVYYNYPVVTNTYVSSPSYTFLSSLSVITPYRIRKKILLGNVGHYDGTDLENWVKTQQVTKYNWFGQELENKEEGIGYNAAIYGYNQQLPICVAKNARHSDVLYESFEDYALLKARPDKNKSYMPLMYSPFEPFFKATTVLDSSYQVGTLAATPSSLGANITKEDAHTGTYSLKVSSALVASLNATDTGMAAGYSFKMFAPRKYVASLWLKSTTAITDARSGYTPSGLYVTMDTAAAGGPGAGGAAFKFISFVAKSNIIDGWQQFEVTFDAPPGYKNFQLQLIGGYYYDDIRLYPFGSNSKGFVYDPITRKLMATLDENNYATFYEYDAEGNLVRTKKETEKGILTITESRSTHHKSN